MIRLFIRGLGFLSLAAALVILIFDGKTSLANETLQFTQLGKLWYDLSPASLNLMQAGVQRFCQTCGSDILTRIGPAFWNGFLQPLLQMPAFIPLTVIGLFILLLARRRRAKDSKQET